MRGEILDILIIGAGQAGLALAWHLRNEKLSYRVIERHSRVGDSWRKRYDSLTLFTPRFLSALPGLALTGDANGYASRDEFADYLESYACHFQIPIMLGLGITRLEQLDAHFRAELDNGEILYARAVVLATGAFQKARIPEWAGRIKGVRQLSSETYQNSSQIDGHRVLVVGDGASGRDIAKELARMCDVILASGRPRALMSEKFLGVSSWWWLDKLGILSLSGSSFLGRKLKKSDSFPARANRFSDLERKGVRILPRLLSIQNRQAQFENAEVTEIDTLIWAIGYEDESDWVAVPEAKDSRGQYLHHEGLSPVPKLYFLGRPWQRNRSSALIAGVGADALWLKNKIVAELEGGL